MFKLVITSIEEFVAFTRIIKGEDLDLKEISDITKELNKSTEQLKEAVESQTP